VRVDVTLDFEVHEGCLVKIQDAAWEVNVWSPATDLIRLGAIRAADWNARKSIQVGRSAGSPVWWSSNDDAVMLLIGDNDETWDVSITVPLAIIDEIVSQAERQASGA
jgi:hypothetical protein